MTRGMSEPPISPPDDDLCVEVDVLFECSFSECDYSVEVAQEVYEDREVLTDEPCPVCGGTLSGYATPFADEAEALAEIRAERLERDYAESYYERNGG